MKDMLEKINNSAIKFLTPKPLELTYRIIVKEALKLVGAKYGSIFLKDKTGFNRAYTSAAYLHETLVRKRSNVYKSFVEKRTIIAPIAKTLKAYPELLKHGVKSTVFIPLSYHGKAIGVIAANSTKKIQLSEKEIDFLDLYGAMASLAIRKSKLHSDLNEAVQTRDLFISMAAHELRTPLTTIYGYMQLLQKKWKRSKTVEPHWIDEMMFHTTRLYRLVDDLLEVNKIKSGKFEYSWRLCSLKDVIKTSVDGIKVIYPKREIRSMGDGKIKIDAVIGDFDKLVLVLSNLLENAVKFSPVDTPVTVGIEEQNSQFKIIIQDRGKGIKESEIPNVLKEFYKGKDNYKEGMGIGLFLAHHIIIRHHGSIQLISKEQKGTKVIITLPSLKKRQ